MHPAGTRKRKSDEMAMDSDDQYTVDMASQKIPTKAGSPQPHETPVKRPRVGITAAQKQALIENLQLESMFAPQRERSDDINSFCSYRARPQATRQL